jgi:sugar phosphate isomerase/epimerase
MKLIFTRSKWEMPDMPLPDFLRKVKSAGYDGTEIHFESRPDDPIGVHNAHADHGLVLVAMIITDGKTPSDHLGSLERKYAFAAELTPLQINCHTGKDWFTHDENLAIFRRSIELSKEYGIPISHETHRGRALYSAVTARELLRALPSIRLTADFSHWCCVHESLLQDQQEAVSEAIAHVDYIHARVGHAEGPQVSDPRAPEWRNEVDAHVRWWKEIAEHHRRRGSDHLAICPEFGPAPYMPTLPYTRQPVADLWDITLAMLRMLKEKLGDAGERV